MRSALALLLLTALTAPAGAADPATGSHKATCVAVSLLDQDNLPLATEKPVVALMIGEKPVIPEGAYPLYSALRPGLQTPCPPALIESIAASYRESCLTEDRRKKAATDNNATKKSVDENCKIIQDSMGESLTVLTK